MNENEAREVITDDELTRLEVEREVSATRDQIVNDLRQRAKGIHRDEADPLVGRLFNALTAGAGSRGLAMEAYTGIAYQIEQGTSGGCSCDGDPIECNHEAAAGWHEEKARQLGDLVKQIHAAAFMGGQDGKSVRRFIQQMLVAAEKSGVIDANGTPADPR